MSDDTSKDTKLVALAKSSLWSTWIGRAIVLCAAWVVLPMDKVLKQAIVPVAKDLALAGELFWTQGTEHVATVANWFKRYARRTIGIGLLVSAVCIPLVIIGIESANPYLVAAGVYLWTIYLLATWFIARTMFKPLSELAEAGVNFTGTVLGDIFKKIGLAEIKKNESGSILTLNLKGFRSFLDQTFVMVVVSLVTGTLVTFTTYVAESAPWMSCGAFFVAGLAVAVMLSTANGAKVDPEAGWKFLYRWSYRLALTLVVFGLAIAIVPPIREQMVAVRTWINAWVHDPHFAPGAAILMLLPIAAIVVCSALAAWYAGDNKKKAGLFAKLAATSVVLAVALPLVLIGNGQISTRDVATVSARVQASAVAVVLPNRALKAPPVMEDIKAPNVSPTVRPSASKSDAEEFLIDDWK